MAGGHSDTQNGRVERVRLKQLSVFRYLRQPRSATTLKKWRGEESPSVLRRRGCQNNLLILNPIGRNFLTAKLLKLP
ncbi:MAG: hypothetical protein DWQ53_17330 [Microcystis flos-aquae DF17]|nr:MAG: hypothetical protein DWQ53_17330 [Microcystis flos-aquae DF17]